MMPADPDSPTPRTTAPDVAEPSAVEVRTSYRYRWYHKMSSVLFITLCLEIGIFLVVFPWTPWWDSNFFSNLLPSIHDYWDNMYLRGAISGLGFVNLYISLAEALRLRRFAKH